MVEKRNRNGGGRDRDEDQDEDSGSAAPEGGSAARKGEDAALRTSPGPAPVVATKRGGTFGSVLLLLLAIAAAAVLYRYWGFWQTEPEAQAAPPPPAVTVAKPLVKEMEENQLRSISHVYVPNHYRVFLSERDRDQFTSYEGPLRKELSDDLLFVIEPRPYELALETSKAQLSQSEAELQLAQAQLDRTAQLRKNDYATKETYDERVSQVAIAAAARDSAIASVNQAHLNLDYTRVTAPVSGRMGRHEVSVGNLVMGGTAGSTTLLTTIVSLDPIWLTFNVSEGDGMTYKRLVQKGEIRSARDNTVKVEGQLMDEKTWTVKGTIDFVDNQYNRSSGTIRVRAAFPNPDLFITPGQFGRVRVPMSQLRPTILVPDAAVVTDQSVKVLFTVTDDGTVVPKQVELGAVTDDGLRIIRSGITPDDRIIINGLLRARPGAKVTAEEGTIGAPAAPQAASPS